MHISAIGIFCYCWIVVVIFVFKMLYTFLPQGMERIFCAAESCDIFVCLLLSVLMTVPGYDSICLFFSKYISYFFANKNSIPLPKFG